MKKSHLERGALGTVTILILVLIGFWLLWYFSGGPQNPNINTGPFYNPDTNQGYGGIGH